MTEEFATLDFALVAAPPATVALALAAVWPEVTAPPAAISDVSGRSGWLGRLMGGRGRSDPPEPASRLTLHTAGLVPDPPFARVDLVAPPLRDSAIRLSAVTAPDGTVTLLELMEELDGDARLCRALSRQLPDAEVFFFRYSGALHPGAHFALHVYKGGRPLRRAESRSLSGAHSEADWQAIDAGMVHPVEADSLPPPDAPAADIMTPERQGAILGALGVDADRLFAGMETRSDVIVLSPLPGGAPVGELRSAAEGATLVSPPAFAAAPPAPEAEEDDDDAGPPARSPAPRRAPLTRLPPDAPLPETPEAWEAEVTGLLLASVEAALPEAERVTWLASFTAQLEAGQTEAALDAAERMIAGTGRPPAERARAAARMRALYSHLAPDTGSRSAT